MPRNALATLSLASALTIALTSLVSAQGAPAGAPTGVWIDHTGRGAVEITECGGGALCGHIVWVKDAKHIKTCRNQVLGGVKPVGGNTWDRGWIVDPDDDSRYTVELKPVGSDRLRVVGYMGSKLFSETMTWKRAPADLKRCDGKDTPEATPVSAPPAPVPAQPAPARSVELTPAPTAPEAPAQVSPYYPAPQRQAATPAPQPPYVAPPAAAPVIVETPEQQPVPSRQASRQPEPEAAPADAEPAPRGKKAKAKTCKVELPYITLNLPCDTF